uniref:Trichohyalin-plectin-homology domain-containing protein n=1 Tax=Amphiprion ocellaris TaxID=80972 RepID=A0A3Q1ANS1_AMPOC
MQPEKETVISKATLERIQARLNKPELKVYTRQQVADIHLEKMEQNRFPGQKQMIDTQWLRQKEERTAQRLAHKEHWDRMVAEETEFKQQQRQKLLDRAADIQFQRRGDVKSFNRQIQFTYVQLENEALMNLQREKMKKLEDDRRQYADEMRRRQMEVQKQEQEKTRQQQLRSFALADEQRAQHRQKKLLEEAKKREKQEEERFFKLQKKHEQEVQDQIKIRAEVKERMRKEREEEISKRHLQRELEVQRMMAEEEERKCYQTHMEEKQRLIQKRRDEIVQLPPLFQATMVKDQAAMRAQEEEKRRQRAVEENIIREARRMEENKWKRREMEKSISQYNKENIRQKNEKKKAEQKADQDRLKAQIQADISFNSQQKEKARRMREENIKINEDNAAMEAQKRARAEQEKENEERATMKTKEQLSKMEERCKLYVQSELDKAAAEKRNVSHLLRTTLPVTGLFTGGEESSLHQKLTAKDLVGGIKYKQPTLPPVSNTRPQRIQLAAPLVNCSTQNVLPPITTKKKNVTILPASTSKPKLRQNVLPAISRK